MKWTEMKRNTEAFQVACFCKYLQIVPSTINSHRNTLGAFGGQIIQLKNAISICP